MVVFTIYQFKSLDLKPDGVVENEYKLYLDNGNLLTYKCKYYLLRCRMAGITESVMVAYTHKYAEV